MRIIIACVLLSCLAAIAIAADEHRPVKKKDDRGKRNLEYQISHHYSGPLSYRLERRISTGPQHPLYPPSQFYPGPPRPYTSYRKDSHNDLGRDDLLTDNNHIQEHIHQENHGYGPHKPHIIERPVYIKEPEPIIEIIIKESNVSLPTPPPTPPPKKKKEQVQVFYVKYKKNPHGVGKDSVIYDKPIPAISPKLPDDDEDEEEEEAPYSYHRESATAPPPPTTTLRTIIKPDSEVYHSPSGVKVTFGKESFDYEKRSSKPEDYNPPQRSPAPQGRQLTSFSNTYFKRPSTNQNSQPPPSNYRAPQPYRPFSFPPPPPTNYKPFGRQSPPQFPPQPKYPFQSPPYTKPTSQQYSSFPSSRPQSSRPPQFSHTVSHPAPAHFQNSRPPPPQTRQPVPYQPFDNLRPQQSFPQPPQQHSQTAPHINPNPQPQIQFRPETHFPTHQQLPLAQQPQSFNPTSYSQPNPQPNIQQQFRQEEPPQARPQHVQFPQQSQHGQQLQQVQQPQQPLPTHYQHQINHNDFRNQQVQNQQQNHQQNHQQQQQQQQQEQISQNEHFNNIQAAQSILPPGGQLIQSVPKYEQHVSEVQSVDGHKTEQRLSPQDFQQKIFQQFNLNQNAGQNNQQHPQQELLQQQQFDQQRQQQQFDQQRQQQRQQEQEELRTAQQYYHQDQAEQQRNLQQDFSYTTPRSAYQSTKRTTQYISSTPRITYQSTTTKPTTTTTQEPETPSTTTKDPKILEAQLPDEVPEELREQLLSSGILNNADISILDYDKVGDIPLSALPPDQLANFYNAGGGAQLTAGSAPVPSILQTDGSVVEDRITETEEDQEPEGSEIEEVRAASPPGVEMKVVRYDPDTEKGQKVQEAYVKDGAQQVDPVVLNDNTYNRYLPLKVNGTQFPIPDVPELKGKKISSVVVLAPVTYDFSSGRKTRDTKKQPNDIDLIQGDDLKQLLTNPSSENYKKFLESENKTRSDKQAVILLVTDPQDSSSKEKEIYMYDVATQTVSKLSGELSSAFVEAAEANSEDNPEDSPSNIVETRVPFVDNVDRQDFHPSDADLDDSASDLFESKVPIIDPMQGEDMETEASEQVQSIVDISGRPIILEDLAVSGNELNSLESQVFINSGYSKTGHS